MMDELTKKTMLWANMLLRIEKFGRLTKFEADFVRRIHIAVAQAEDAKLKVGDA